MTETIEDLDPGIRLTVAWLNEHSFETTDSGDGVSKHGIECALNLPNVFMRIPPWAMVVEANRIRALLLERGIVLTSGGDAEGQRLRTRLEEEQQRILGELAKIVEARLMLEAVLAGERSSA